MIDKLQRLETLLETMITNDEDITARAVCRRSEGTFRHASDITRNVDRRRLLRAAMKKQKAIRDAVGRSSQRSRFDLEKLLATKNSEIDALKADRELLIASHRAMILAITEMGGFETWSKFFEKYQSTISRIDEMRAIHKIDILPLPSPSKS